MRFNRILAVVGAIAVSFAGMSNATAQLSSSSNNGYSYGSPVTINQGDKIVVSDHACTLTYIGDDYAITAGHCGNTGEKVYTSTGSLIGKVELNVFGNDTDVSIIGINPNVNGYNAYSGNAIGSFESINTDDELCQYSRNSGNVMCTDDYYVYSGLVIMETTAIAGDSGGPVWIKDGNLVGLISYEKSIISTGGQVYKAVGVSELQPTINKYNNL